MPISEATASLVLDELKTTPDISRVARRLGLPIQEIYDIAQIRTTGFKPLSADGWGREDLRPYIVARKRATDLWQYDDPDIILAKCKYDSGQTEVCTGRDGDWLILYSIPRKKRVKRDPYFSRSFGDE